MPDKQNSFLFKQCSTRFVPILHTIFNTLIEQCVMHNVWKVGKIVPIQKKPLPNVDNDLWPVTLTVILAKHFKKAILPKIVTHTQSIMDQLQFPYQANRSTDDTIITLINAIAQHLDGDSKYASTLFVGYYSAFNIMQPISLLAESQNTMQYYSCQALTSSQIDNNMCEPNMKYLPLLLYRSTTMLCLVRISFSLYIYQCLVVKLWKL